MADSTAQWAAPGPSAPPTRPRAAQGAPYSATPQSVSLSAAVPGEISGVISGAAPGAQHPGAARPRLGAARRSGTRPIPLRPLSVLEVIDAGAGALRSIPRRVHLIAAALTAALGLLGFALLFLVEHHVDVLISHGSYASTDFFGDVTVYEGVPSPATSFGRFLLFVLFAVVFTGMAATIVTGLYASSVQRYVDGQPPDLDAARTGYRGRGLALVWMTLLASLPRLLVLGLAVLFTLDSAAHQGGGAGAGFWWLMLIGTPTCFLATAKTAVAAPALILERIPAGKAFSRSSRLATGGHWRSGWTSLFALVTAHAPILLLMLYLAFNRFLNSASGSFTSMFSGLDLILTAVVIVASVPLRATTATMIYVDRRFRREGLDVRIAWARVAKEAL